MERKEKEVQMVLLVILATMQGVHMYSCDDQNIIGSMKIYARKKDRTR